MSSSELIRQLHREGWVFDRISGSHHVFKHLERLGIVVVPRPRKDLGLGLLKAIRRQAGLQR